MDENTQDPGAGSGAPAPETAAAAPKTKMVKARVLTPCVHGQPNAVVTLPAAAVKAGVASGDLDDSPAAVAYATLLAPLAANG